MKNVVPLDLNGSWCTLKIGSVGVTCNYSIMTLQEVVNRYCDQGWHMLVHVGTNPFSDLVGSERISKVIRYLKKGPVGVP